MLAIFFVGWGGDLNKTIEVKYLLFTVQLIGQLPMCRERNISLLGLQKGLITSVWGASTNHYFTMLLSCVSPSAIFLSKLDSLLYLVGLVSKTCYH